MPSIFSTYSTGENRVTASFLAVLRSLSLDRMQRLLASILGESEFELIRFQNQPSKGGDGVPDAIILSSVRLLVETKTERNAVNLQQLKRHLSRLDDKPEAFRTLMLITPDNSIPVSLEEFGEDNNQVVWASFATIDQAIDEILDDSREVVSEREAYLMRELQEMLLAEGLLANENDVVIVAARNAWPEYQATAAYICQAARSFQQVQRMGFYTAGQIFSLIPKIDDVYDNVEMISGQHEGRLGQLVDQLVKAKLRQEGAVHNVFLLSPPDSPETVKLEKEIRNDKKSKSGKNAAFTMGQRYVSLDALKGATTTSDLED